MPNYRHTIETLHPKYTFVFGDDERICLQVAWIYRISSHVWERTYCGISRTECKWRPSINYSINPQAFCKSSIFMAKHVLKAAVPFVAGRFEASVVLASYFRCRKPKEMLLFSSTVDVFWFICIVWHKSDHSFTYHLLRYLRDLILDIARFCRCNSINVLTCSVLEEYYTSKGKWQRKDLSLRKWNCLT